MAWKVIDTTDKQHLGLIFEFVNQGDKLKMSNEFEVYIDKLTLLNSGTRMVVSNQNYIVVLDLET